MIVECHHVLVGHRTKLEIIAARADTFIDRLQIIAGKEGDDLFFGIIRMDGNGRPSGKINSGCDRHTCQCKRYTDDQKSDAKKDSRDCHHTFWIVLVDVVFGEFHTELIFTFNEYIHVHT